MSSADSPRGGLGDVRGLSSLSHGLEVTISIRIRNLKKALMHDMRAPMVMAEGSLPDRPMPWAYANTSCAVTKSGGFPSRPKNS